MAEESRERETDKRREFRKGSTLTKYFNVKCTRCVGCFMQLLLWRPSFYAIRCYCMWLITNKLFIRFRSERKKNKSIWNQLSDHVSDVQCAYGARGHEPFYLMWLFFINIQCFFVWFNPLFSCDSFRMYFLFLASYLCIYSICMCVFVSVRDPINS